MTTRQAAGIEPMQPSLRLEGFTRATAQELKAHEKWVISPLTGKVVGRLVGLDLASPGADRTIEQPAPTSGTEILKQMDVTRRSLAWWSLTLKR